MQRYENKNICSSCGGVCCKKSGCDYFVSDFPSITKSEILKALETGNISIVAGIDIQKINGKTIAFPILYLRARNKDRDVVDLFSMKRECSMLTETGCSYDLEHRPSGGATLIPKKNIFGIYECRPSVDHIKELEKWLPHQNLLGKMVKRYTGKSVNEVFREDVERVFFEVMTEQYEGVSELEIHDLGRTLPQLAECFPTELNNAREKYKKAVKIYKKIKD